MVEGNEGAVSDSVPGSKSGSKFESTGDRLRFTVELRPGETTIVSWKKLLREATSSKSKPGELVSVTSAGAQLQPVSQPAHSPPHEAPSSSKLPMENEPMDSQGQAGTNRLSNVIERIERMYAGNGSGDEEDVVLDNVPDDDEYDTEDSFIDDTELDDYFQIDNSSIKHDGFFVNRGKLEGIEPIIPIKPQPKKRKREDLAKGHGGSDDGHDPNKNVKIGNKVRKTSTSTQRKSGNQSHKGAMPNIHGEGIQFQASPTNTAEVSLKNKTAESQTTINPSGPLNGDAIRQDVETDQQRSVVLSLKNHVSKQREIELQDTSTQRTNNKSSHASKSRFEKQKNDGIDQLVQQKGKGGLVARFDLNVPAMGASASSPKAALMQRKESSSVRSKSTTLDKAIRELEKIVSEFTPPSTEVKDPDNSSQAVKRRLPPIVKQKLEKVGRLAQISYGKIPKDLINHLMSIVGHLMQVRTLKRNLKVVANTELSVKQEKDKDDIIQKMKQEVAEMIKMRVLSIKSKVEQQAANSDDFQEAGPEEKKALRRKYMDDLLENKICDLYDLYVERSEENSGPSVRRLYEELVVLWPSGSMDIDGIRRAIYRAKDRRGLCSMRKDQEKIKKKSPAPKAKEAINITQTQHIREKSSSDSRHKGLTSSTSKPVITAPVAAHSAARVPISSANDAKMEKLKKKEKHKASSSSNPVDTTPPSLNVLPKKKIKRKENAEAVEAQFRFEKMVASKAEDPPKHRKHLAVPLTKSNLQPAVPSGS